MVPDTLARTGAVICVKPGGDVCYDLNERESGYLDSHCAFEMLVSGVLAKNGHIYGVYGPVISGPNQYTELICSLLMRAFPPKDWNCVSEDHVNFKIGPSVAEENQSFCEAELGGLSFYCHPDGTIVKGYPRFCRFGYATVVQNQHNPTESTVEDGP
jgi:hypothetical protein